MTDGTRHGRRTTPLVILGALALSLLSLTGVLRLFGWSPALVVGGSMRPAVQPGDVVVTSPMPGDGFRPGHVVRFHDPGRPGRQMLHRITRIDEHGRLRTKGDANRVEDLTPVPRSSVTGRGRLRVPYLGVPALWWLEGRYARVTLMVVAVLVLCTPSPGAWRRAGPAARSPVCDRTAGRGAEIRSRRSGRRPS